MSVRLFGKQSFYNDPMTILVYLKLFHAEALRTLHPLHKDIAFLDGGVFHGCTVAQPDSIRDTLYVRPSDVKTECRQVNEFSQFWLISNFLYLNPQATAAHLFNTKSATDDTLLGNLKKSVKAWKKSQFWRVLHSNARGRR